MQTSKERPTTIRDVARVCGVSAMAVSRVLNNQPGEVSKETRERILHTMRELNYHPSAVARGLSRKRMNTVGIILSNPHSTLYNDRYVCGLLDGIMAATRQGKQNTTIFTGQTWSDARQSLPAFCDGRCDGLILISPSVEADIVPALLEVEMPFVLIHNSHEDPRVSSVDIDHIAAMRALVQHVIEQGHRRIAMLGGRRQSRSATQRLEGYRQALTAARIEEDTDLVSMASYSQESGYQRTRLLLRRFPDKRPTALCCGNDSIAIGAMQALREAEVRVPEEMSVTGFDDLPEATIVSPPLSTVRQPLQDLGWSAAEILLTQIETKVSLGRRELLPTEIVLRRSVMPPVGARS